MGVGGRVYHTATKHYQMLTSCATLLFPNGQQVPQFLYEAGFGCAAFPERAGAVGVTQPRRVAAISTAERVADELDTRLGKVVGYQVGNLSLRYASEVP